jgi:DnaK suppressor protein
MAKKRNKREVEDKLAALRDELSKELNSLLEQCRVSATHRPTEILDIASDGEADDMAARLAEADATRIEEIEEALQRLHAGRYGICRECGKRIPQKRLRVMPFASLCIHCKEDEERREGTAMRPRRRRAVDFQIGLDEPAEDDFNGDEDLYRRVSRGNAVE